MSGAAIPKISVVMPSFNQAAYVEEAIRSVLDQEYANLELIFIDGGSTDGTLEIAGRYRGRMAHFESGPDKGQSDAMQRGIARATGDLVTWLNTDDLLLPGALKAVARLRARDPGADWIFGNVIWIDAQGAVVRCFRSEAMSRLADPRAGFLTAGGPTAFFTRDLFDRVGGFDPELHFMMDTDLWWRFAMAGARFKRLPGYTWALRLHSEAKTSAHRFTTADDPAQIRRHQAQTTERARIEDRRRGFLWGLPAPVSTAMRLTAKAMTPGRYRAMADTMKWRGRPVRELTGARP